MNLKRGFHRIIWILSFIAMGITFVLFLVGGSQNKPVLDYSPPPMNHIPANPPAAEPTLNPLIGGLLLACFVFFVVFFMGRGLVALAIWVGMGFKEEPKPKKEDEP